MDETLVQLPNLDVYGKPLPQPEQGLAEAKRLMAKIFRANERIWLVDQTYDPVMPAWLIDVVRQGANGRWVRQRYMYDEAAQVVHFRGESALSDAQLREMRRTAEPFPVNS